MGYCLCRDAVRLFLVQVDVVHELCEHDVNIVFLYTRLVLFTVSLLLLFEIFVCCTHETWDTMSPSPRSPLPLAYFFVGRAGVFRLPSGKWSLSMACWSSVSVSYSMTVVGPVAHRLFLA